MKRWLLIIGVVVGLSVLGAALALKITDGMTDVAEAFLSDLSQGQFEQAHARMSTEFRELVSLTDLDRLRAGTQLTGLAEMNWLQRWAEGNNGELHGTIQRADGAILSTSLAMVKEQGEWRITGVEISDPGPQGPAG